MLSAILFQRFLFFYSCSHKQFYEQLYLFDVDRPWICTPSVLDMQIQLNIEHSHNIIVGWEEK